MRLLSRHEARRRKAEAKRRHELKWQAKEILGRKEDLLATRWRLRQGYVDDFPFRLFLENLKFKRIPMQAQIDAFSAKLPAMFERSSVIADLIRKR